MHDMYATYIYVRFSIDERMANALALTSHIRTRNAQFAMVDSSAQISYAHVQLRVLFPLNWT